MTIEEFVSEIHDGYVGTEEIGIAMHKCYVNARELNEDAKTLLEKRPARSISLAILAIEELAKVVLLMNGTKLTSKQKVKWSTLQKQLNTKSHQQKQEVFASYGKSILDILARQHGKKQYYKIDMPNGISKLVDWFKQLGFYVDYTTNGFISPSEFGNENKDWAKYFIELADERLDSLKSMHEDKEHSILLAKIASKINMKVESES